MTQDTFINKPLYNLLPSDIEGFDALTELALDLRWSWDHSTDEIWQQLDPVLWALTHHPWDVLQTVSREKVQSLLADPAFRNKVDAFAVAKQQAKETPKWFDLKYPQSPLSCVAYFSMEFMLSEALPIYSGGLGNVAGDQLKAASDLGIPVVGVGLLYQQGYFRQIIDQQGKQQALYPYNDPGQLPITPLRHPNGEWLRLEIHLPAYSVWLRTWQVQVGNVKLYLLDSNDPANFPIYRGITSELYGGGAELRLQQEMVLGMGGWRLLQALGIQPEVCHLNEGHAALLILERAKSFMASAQQPFEVALAVTRAGNLFTTHTAVEAGFDRFEPALIAQYLGRYAEQLGLSLKDLLALGRQNPDDDAEPFNMAYLAIRGSGGVNGVSRLHGQVSRQLFAPLFPHWPEEQIPIGHITNGVHIPTWDSAEADTLWTEACGKGRWLDTMDQVADDIRQVSDEALWAFRQAARQSFVAFVRESYAKQLAVSGAPAAEIADAHHIFNPNVLTLGFARRFATYKRPNMLLQDPERLLRLLSNPQRPVQLILSGKAHPADHAGQALIEQWMQFIQQHKVSRQVIFLSDYNMRISECMVQGVDVWMNTPRRPWEACGTSGMKVLVNGGLNLSELDGWWAEAYTPDVGWALGDGLEHHDDPAWDEAEALKLFERLEQAVIPEFYERDHQGMPRTWVARMRESMATLTPLYSSNRAIREYTEQYYLALAADFRLRNADQGAMGKHIIAWQDSLKQQWPLIHFGSLSVETKLDQYLITVELQLHQLKPESVQVELYADGILADMPWRLYQDDAAPEADMAVQYAKGCDNIERVRVEMQRQHALTDQAGVYSYCALVSANRPASDYTARIIPHFQGVAVPLEADQILWQCKSQSPYEAASQEEQ